MHHKLIIQKGRYEPEYRQIEFMLKFEFDAMFSYQLVKLKIKYKFKMV